ncbi:hypothetical protein ACO2RV_17025 [Ancylobacter sp. VNQ12]|uniref:hypothetical protein n=1 Tax=Ancylobacter sp. VNQ12 TaxID=3400920 RepID=UPI003BFE2817
MIAGKVVNKKVFDTLVSRVSTMNSKMSETRGELGSFIKDAEETHGIHRAAFKLACKLNAMDDLKMKDFLRGFDLYREYLKLDTRANSDLLEDDEESEEEAAGEAGTDDAEWEASAPDGDEPEGDSENEAIAPGVVKVGGQTVNLGERRRQMEAAKATAGDGSTTDPEEMGRRPAGNPLDDLTAGTTR